MSSSALPTVADRPIRCCAVLRSAPHARARRGDAIRGRRRRTHEAQQRPRGRRAASDARRPGDEDRLDDSGVVRRMSGGSAIRRFRSGWPMSPCHGRAADQAGEVRNRGSRLFRARSSTGKGQGRASSRRACGRTGRGRLGLAPAVGASSNACSPSRIGPIAAPAWVGQAPAERVDGGAAARDGGDRRAGHSSSSTSSGSDPERAARSTSVSSPSETVRA